MGLNTRLVAMRLSQMETRLKEKKEEEVKEIKETPKPENEASKPTPKPVENQVLDEFLINTDFIVSNRITTASNKSSLPKALTDAINSGDVEQITKALYKLGISYVSDRDPDKNYQVARLVKFIYDGKEYNIPCEYKNIEMQMHEIDNSVEAQLKSLVNALKSGHKERLKDLEKLGVEYNMQENEDGSYVVTFDYEGKGYVAASDFISKELTSAINSGNVESITQALYKLGVSYVSDRDPDKNYQAARLVKFIYDGKEYNIPCEYKNIEVDKGVIDNSIEAQLKYIVEDLKRGNKESLNDLEKLGIEYNMQENEDGSYVVTFDYKGKSYVAASDFISKELTSAINSGDVEQITQALDKLGISYIADRDPDKNYQVARLVKFIYDGKEYNIPCEYKNIEVDKGVIDNSVEAQLKYIVDDLKRGNKESLKDLEKLGIEYNMQENEDGSYVVTFDYKGKSYVAAYSATTNTHPVGTPNPYLIDLFMQNMNNAQFNFFS